MKLNLPQRRLIPRWRPVANTLLGPESCSLNDQGTPVKRAVEDQEADFENAVRLWHDTKAPGVLGEVLSFSVNPSFKDRSLAVGREALATGAAITQVQSLLVKDLSEAEFLQLSDAAFDPSATEGAHPFQAPIRRLRALLKSAPDNALALLDYAQFQAANGKLKAAEKSIRTALSLSPDNRTVLRTAARFFVHAEKEGFAHQLIRRHQRTPNDPWLMASEIALADVAGAESVFLSKGKRFLHDHAKFSAAHLTELSGVIATEELKAGNLKKARESQRRALLAPNDNLIAQAVDLQQHFGIVLDGRPITEAIAKSNEAQVLQSWLKMRPEDVQLHAQKWHNEEPFSSRPIQLLSTVHAYRKEHMPAMEWIRAGLLTDSQDKGLLINLAFVQAYAGTKEKATLTIRKLRHLYRQSVEPYVRATEGLIEYTVGNFEQGDASYDEAAIALDAARQQSIAAYCRVNQALAAIDFHHPRADQIVALASEKLKAFPSADALMLLKVRSIPEIQTTETKMEQRRIEQWVFDPTTNTLTHKPGLTAIGAPSVILHRA